jgi:hypothetical protein
MSRFFLLSFIPVALWWTPRSSVLVIVSLLVLRKHFTMFRKLLTALLLLSGTGFVNARVYRPYDFGVDCHTVDKRQSSQVIRIGRIGNDGDAPRIRQELRELKSDFYKWNLYLLALNILQTTETDRPDSWYQIAGKRHHTRRFLGSQGLSD